MPNFEDQITHNLEGYSKDTFELMKLPEIVVEKERGAQLFSLLLNAENAKWGETETPLAQEIAEYFEKHPISQKILDEINNFHEQGVDEETLYNLALTYQRPERAKYVLEMATKYKPHVKNPEEVYQKFIKLLEDFDQTFSGGLLAEKIDLEVEKDKRLRIERLEETKTRIKNLIDFYKPDAKTSDIQKVSFVPTNPLHRKNSGRAFSAFPHEQIIISHIDNIDNQDHEFCHGIINPIVEKLSEKLTEKQKKKISELASGQLKKDYGENYFSLLCEEFIRTYNDFIKKDEKPQTYDEFAQKVSQFNEEQFQESMINEKTKSNFDKLKIRTLDDLKSKSKEYFEQFQKNMLQDLVFEFYQKYINRPNKESENFERFVLKNFSEIL